MGSISGFSKRLAVVMALLCLVLAVPAPMLTSAHEDSVFVSIRVYHGLEPEDPDGLYRRTAEEFMEIIRETDGFIGYYWLHAGENVVAINLFESEEQALASTEAASAYIAENLAAVVPFPPLVVEGVVDIGFVEALDGMGDGDASSLYASVRIYDGFAAEDQDAFVAIVEDGFLPIMRGTDGFFGYYLLHDGDDTLGAVSIFDSEASALASNAAAADFVAENLTAYLPSSPVIVSGSVGIATLSALEDGVNLIDGKLDQDDVFVSIRRYDGVDPQDIPEIQRYAIDVYVPFISASDGFIGYYWWPQDDAVVAMNLFTTPEEAAASNESAREQVAEHLAHLLPNPPQIFEGFVEIAFVELLDGMADRDVSSLFASLRVYDEFSADSLSEFVALVEDGFLPIMRGTDGFFGYYLLHDAEGRLGSVSIFNSEASALASNAAASDFVAENLTAFLPKDPQITSGELHIAVLSALEDGANLIDDAVFASIRVYAGVDPANQDEIARLTNEGFLPIMRASDGFVGYYLLPAGDRLASVSLFDSAEQAAASNEAARDFVAEYLAPLLPNAPLIVEGAVEVAHVEDADEMMMAEGMTSPHALLAIYDGFDMARLDETVALIESVFLPDLRENGGLFSYYGISDGVDKAVSLRIMDSEQSLQQGSDIAAEFVAEYLADWLPEDPLLLDGRLAIAAVNALAEGVNLATHSQDEDSVFASVRVYAGVDPDDQDEIVRQITERLPVIRGRDGFVGYYLLPAGDMLAVISLFETAEQASASKEAAREFVAENLAPLLPNAPRIFVGPLSMDYVAALSDGDEYAGVDELYASIRFYEGFDLRHFEEANDLAIAHLLPAMQDLSGFFAQYALNDGVDTVVGISIFEGEEAALAANDVGKAFTIEYLADWAPNPPTGVAGEIAIASLAEIHLGENLIAADTEQPAFASIRVYDGIDPADQDEILRITSDGFLPIMRESDGFVGYYLLPAGDMLASVSLFDSAEHASASNAAARDFVTENLAPLLPNPPRVTEGALDVNFVADEMMVEGLSSLYAALRVYDNYDLTDREEAVELVETGFLPILQGADGLFSYFSMDDGVDRVVTLSVYDTEENALAANVLAADFVAEYMTGWIRDEPTRINGRLGVTAIADLRMGANLIGRE